MNGGKGNGSIDINFSAITTKGLIQGGSDDGDDTIRLALDTYSSTSVYGGGGNDSIVISGSTDNGTNLFEAGTGNDTVFFQSAGADTISGSTIKGGAGNDSILIEAEAVGAVQSGLTRAVLVTTPLPLLTFLSQVPPVQLVPPSLVVLATPSPSVLSVVSVVVLLLTSASVASVSQPCPLWIR